MYVKLFASLYQGTLRGRADEILVFTNLLAHADQHGVVDKHWKAIAEETGLDKERVVEAIKNLESPDEESRSPEMGGCRIVRLDDHRAWGWQIVNYGKYRAIRNEDDRREQNRAAQEKWRNNHRKPQSAQAEAYTEAEALKPKPLVETSPPPGLNKTAWETWVDYRKQIRKPLKPVSMQAAQRNLAAYGDDQEAVVQQSIANGYQGLVPLKNGGNHATHQHTDNSAPARVKRANERQSAATGG